MTWFKNKVINSNIDGYLFIPAMLLITIACTFLALNPEEGLVVINKVFAWITEQFGWLYLLTGFGCFWLMLWLAFGPIGRIKLGAAEDKPEFSTISWISMLFCAGIGVSILNWAFIEPIYIYAAPPFGITPKSDEAIEWAAMYPLIHWGFVPWSLYLLPTLPIAYNLFVRKKHIMRFSDACRSLLGDLVNGPIGRAIDIIVIMAIIGGVGTSLGLAVPLVAELIENVFNITNNFWLEIGVLLVWMALIFWSVYQGLGKGIQVLSNINSLFAFAILLIVAIVGPTLFMLDLWTNSVGLMLDNFFRINTWTDPIAESGFAESWTIFYWAWWVACSPMMGLFVARISRGRTIKELILNGVIWGASGTWVFFAIWGGYAIHLETTGSVALSEILTRDGIPETVLAVLQSIPMASMVIPLFIILSFIFVATTVDSAAYTLASITSKEITGYQEPSRVNRLLWTLLIAFVGIGLLSVGGLKAAQTSTIIVALPMIPILAIMTISFLKSVYEDFGDQLKEQPFVATQYQDQPTNVAPQGAAKKTPKHTVTPIIAKQ